MLKRKNRIFGIAIVATVIVAGSIFYACKKDRDGLIPKEQKSSYFQPVQDIAIHTFIEIEGVDYPVVGNAVAGNYNGQIYECNLTWIIPVASGDFSMNLVAKLKPQFHGSTTVVEPVIVPTAKADAEGAIIAAGGAIVYECVVMTGVTGGAAAPLTVGAAALTVGAGAIVSSIAHHVRK